MSNFTQEQQAMQQMEAFDRFASEICRAVEEAMLRDYGKHVETELRDVTKTNVTLEGMSVTMLDDSSKDQKITPTIYLEDAYKQYQSGRSMEAIAEDMAKGVMRAYEQAPPIPVLTAEEAKKHITLTLINTAKNQELLSHTPHMEIGDLSAIPRWQVAEGASFIVSEDTCSRLGLTPDEVLAIGQTNINQTEFSISSMQDILKEMVMRDGMPEDMVDAMFPETDGPQMIILTNESRVYGSQAILSDTALQQVREMMGGQDFVILPSSVHEVICVPARDMDADALRQMVREVNGTEVSPQEYLSDSIYKYDGQKLQLVREDPKLDSPEVKPESRTIHYAGMRM